MFLRRDLTDDHNFGFPKIPIELCIIDKKKCEETAADIASGGYRDEL